MIAAAKAHERRRFARQMRIDELAGGAVLQFQCFARFRLDQLDVDQSLGREMHPGLLGAFAPERGRDVADAHDLVDARAPGILQLLSETVFATARLAADDDAFHCAERDTFGGGGLGDVQRIRGRAGERLGLEALDRREEALGVADADRDMYRADRLERGERSPGDERTGSVGSDHAFARL